MYFDGDGMIEMGGEEFGEWLRSLIENNPDFIVVVAAPMDTDFFDFDPDSEIPHEAYDMDKRIHFRRRCPHHNMHGTRDVELELHGHDVVLRAFHNGQRMPGQDGEWPVVQRCDNDADAMRLYLHARKGFVNHDFEIVDA
jgi:hypothetical protein